MDSLPIGNNKIHVQYFRDCIGDETCELHESNHSILTTHATYHRTTLFEKFCCNTLFVYLSFKHMIPSNHIIEPRLSPDACILS